METFNEIKNRQLQAMLEPAREKLKKYSPEDICKKANITYDESEKTFCIQSMGQNIFVHYPDFVMEQSLEMWHHLTLLQYMDTADGAPLTGRWKSLQQMRGSLARGSGFDKDIGTMFERYFSDITKVEFLRACERIGGVMVDGKADVSVIIPYAPMFKVLVNFWEGDDEFPASGKVLVDENAEHYLEIEAAGGACSAVIMEIKKNLLKKYGA